MAISSTSSSYLILANNDKYIKLKDDHTTFGCYVISMENATRFPDNEDQINKLKTLYPSYKIYKVAVTMSLI